MAKTFALITEGASEHFVIKHILQRYCLEEPVINQIQPQLINDKQENIGGWHEVIKYCGRTSDLQEILKRNDYIVIQIDTDMCETEPYSVSRNGAASHQELWAKVRERIVDKNSELSRSVYSRILRNAKKRKDIEAFATYHYGFSQFLKQIEVISA